MTLDDGDELDEASDEEEDNMGLDDLAFDLGEHLPEKGAKEKPGSQRSSGLNQDKLVQMYIQQQRQQNAFNQKLIDQIASQNKVIINSRRALIMNGNTIEWQVQFQTLFREGKFSLSTVCCASLNSILEGKV